MQPLPTAPPVADAARVYRVIFDYAVRIGREQDQSQLLSLMAGLGRDLVGADRCSIWLIDEENQELYTRVADAVGEIRIPFGQGVVGDCVQTGQAIVVNDVASDPRFTNAVDRSSGYRTDSILTVPMRASSAEVIGACQVLNKPGGFAPSDVDLVMLAASYSAFAIETQRLQQQAEMARRLEYDLEIAREVQQRLFPRGSIDGIDCAAECRPARQVGGDYYNFWRLPDGRITVAVGDVAGKGIVAALLMASIQASLHGLVLRGAPKLSDLVSELNRLVYDASTADGYSTLFVAEYRPETKTLCYVNAGQVPPILRHGGGNPRLENLDHGGYPIGLFPVATYEDTVVDMEDGSLLVCASDGVSDSMNDLHDTWGEQAVASFVEASGELPSAEVSNRILGAAQAFAAGAPQFDDMTILVLRT